MPTLVSFSDSHILPANQHTNRIIDEVYNHVLRLDLATSQWELGALIHTPQFPNFCEPLPIKVTALKLKDKLTPKNS